MSYSSFKQAILLLAASELLLSAQAKAQISTESASVQPADLPAADAASLAAVETH
ncbi:hypothetical protein [Neisseria dentiae]|uniref:hypothetical protein n=1 Tax=Neisseria dentiae TaxID=194197 RepID=UPI0035A10264